MKKTNREIILDRYGVDIDKITFSYSGIKNLVVSVERFLMYKQKKFESTPATRFGNAMHTALLEQGEFWKRYVVEPEGINKRTKAGKEEYAKFIEENKDKEVITIDDVHKINSMLKKLHQHPTAGAIFSDKNKNIEKESRLKFQYGKKKMNGFIDFVNHDANIIVDYKTIDDAETDNCFRSISKFKYYIQAWLYENGAKMMHGKNFKAVYVFQEKKAPYDCNVIVLGEDWYDLAQKEFVEALEKWDNFVKKPFSFTGISDKETVADMPGWLKKKVGGKGCTDLDHIIKELSDEPILKMQAIVKANQEKITEEVAKETVKRDLAKGKRDEQKEENQKQVKKEDPKTDIQIKIDHLTKEAQKIKGYSKNHFENCCISVFPDVYKNPEDICKTTTTMAMLEDVEKFIQEKLKPEKKEESEIKPLFEREEVEEVKVSQKNDEEIFKNNAKKLFGGSWSFNLRKQMVDITKNDSIVIDEIDELTIEQKLDLKHSFNVAAKNHNVVLDWGETK